VEQYLEQLKSYLDLLGPNPYVHAAAIVVLFFVVAKIARKVLRDVVGRLVRHSSTDWDDRLIVLLSRPVFVTVVLIGLTMATLRLSEADVLTQTPTDATLSILATIVIYVWTRFALGLSHLALELLKGRNITAGLLQERTLPLLDNVSRIVIVALSIYFILIAWNINVTAWVASAGIIGLAVSFAAKDTLSNLISGMTIIADAPYKLGDFVNLDTGERGQVTHIGLRSTRILTRDDIEVTIPNGVMGNTKIINESGGPHTKYRVRVKVGVAYGSDIDQVIAILMAVADSHDDVCGDPAPRVRFRNFGASSLDFELLCWIDEPVQRGRMLHALNCEVYKAFLRNNIEIPYAKQDVYVKELPAGIG